MEGEFFFDGALGRGTKRWRSCGISGCQSTNGQLAFRSGNPRADREGDVWGCGWTVSVGCIEKVSMILEDPRF